MIRMGCFLLAWIATGCFTKEERMIPKEEYPDFSEVVSARPAEPEITMCPPRTRDHFFVVEIKAMKFVPETLTLRKGDTVMWVNKDITTHDVTEETSHKWQSPSLPAGGSWQKVITEDADYYCSIHVIMKGKVRAETNL